MVDSYFQAVIVAHGLTALGLPLHTLGQGQYLLFWGCRDVGTLSMAFCWLAVAGIFFRCSCVLFCDLKTAKFERRCLLTYRILKRNDWPGLCNSLTGNGVPHVYSTQPVHMHHCCRPP